MSNINKRTKWLIAISAFIVVYISLSLSLFTHPSVQEWLLSFSPNSIANTLLIVFILTCLSTVGVPRQVIAFTCGFFYEVVLGTVLATTIVTLAALVTYLISRRFFRSRIYVSYPTQLTKVNDFLSSQTFSKAVIIRLLPVGSNFLTNILAGVANIPAKPFILGSCVGFIPQMLIFSLAGSGVKLMATEQITISIVLFVIALLLSWQLYRKTPSYRQ